MVNIIWIFLIVSGIIFGLFTNKLEIINTTIVDSTKVSLEMFFKIFPVLALWMGITKIAEVSGLLKKLSNKLSPLLTKIFPEIPSGHESLSLIASNIIANLFGLGSAATPFGLKAMNSLQKLNKNKKVASRSMVTFLVINTSGLTIIPTTIISLRMMYGSLEPTKIVLACLISTIAATIGGIIIDRILARRYKN
ncbi:MAG: spore maturation protein [Clostridiales bacterium]|nr:spore maturation protein [Clostridiales bacterium]